MSGEALTIGEVIGRLAADFPDLTVSKIRYLESGGLISPGRTPAGYRRFSEDDVEKLRWVLAAQRDQYLPLKVIRQHLAADGPRGTAGDPDEIVAALTAGAERAPAPGSGAMVGCFATDDADTSATAAAVGAAATAAATAADAALAAATDTDTAAAADPTSPAPPQPPPAPLVATRTSPAALTPPLPPIPQPRTRAATVADPEFFAAAGAGVGELHLHRDGLARTAGVSESFVAELISYSLLPAAEAYGGDAVFVVRAAAALVEFGLEPRHLRPLLTGARTTAGLLAGLLPARRHDGVASPGRQAAAAKAAARSAQASAAAVRLYAALLRAELSAPAPAATMPGTPPADSSRNPGMPGGPPAR